MAAYIRCVVFSTSRLLQPVSRGLSVHNHTLNGRNIHTKVTAGLVCQTQHQRWFSRSTRSYAENTDDANAEEINDEGAQEETVTDGVHRLAGKPRRTHDLATSQRYLQSKAYEITYGGVPVWVPYRRNHKGLHPPSKTRKTCVRGGIIATGNPCPVCRDEYLVVHPENLELLKQFINPRTGEVLSYQKTGVCQMQHKNLIKAVYQAWDMGLLEKPIPFREYDYSQYYPKELVQQSSQS